MKISIFSIFLLISGANLNALSIPCVTKWIKKKKRPNLKGQNLSKVLENRQFQRWTRSSETAFQELHDVIANCAPGTRCEFIINGSTFRMSGHIDNLQEGTSIINFNSIASHAVQKNDSSLFGSKAKGLDLSFSNLLGASIQGFSKHAQKFPQTKQVVLTSSSISNRNLRKMLISMGFSSMSPNKLIKHAAGRQNIITNTVQSIKSHANYYNPTVNDLSILIPIH